jgi:hypothetical protein
MRRRGRRVICAAAIGLGITPAPELLSRKYRVVACEMPGCAASAKNMRTRDMAELAQTMVAAAQAVPPLPDLELRASIGDRRYAKTPLLNAAGVHAARG